MREALALSFAFVFQQARGSHAEPEPDETGCPKSEVERLIERINAIQSELPAHRAVYYEDEKAFSDAAEEHYAALYRALPAERRKR